MIGFARDLAGEIPCGLRVIDAARCEGLREELDRGQRGSQLVADVRHEVAAHALDTPQGRDVVQREDQAAFGEGYGVDRELASTQVAEGRLTRSTAPGQSLSGDRVQRGGSERGDQAHAHDPLLAPLSQARCLRPGPNDAQAFIHEQQEVPAAPAEERLEGRRRTGHGPVMMVAARTRSRRHGRCGSGCARRCRAAFRAAS